MDQALHSDSRETGRQYLTFRLGGEEYGIDILSVQEIRGFEPTTRIPRTPQYLLGVINLRGTVVPIVDLRLRFELDDAAVDRNTVTILVNITGETGTRTLGLVVDAVSDVHLVRAEDLGTSPTVDGPLAGEFLAGIATAEERMLVLLDVESLAAAVVGHAPVDETYTAPEVAT